MMRPDGDATVGATAALSREVIEFRSDDEFCAATFYRPDRPADVKLPCVILAHGLSAVRDQLLHVYAERFCAEGFAVLTFDYRSFGESGGEPRQVADIGRQHRDLHNAIAYARSRPDVDPDSIALWGTSYGGGHVLCAAADDPRICAVIAQVPHVNLLTGPPGGITFSDVRRLLPYVVADEIARLRRRNPEYVPVTGDTGTMRLLTQPGVQEEFQGITPPSSSWRNQIAPRILLRTFLHRPGRRVREIKCPLLFTLGAADIMTRPEPALRAARRAGSAQVQQYPCDHFGVYFEPWLSRIANDQAAFLRAVVPAAR